MILSDYTTYITHDSIVTHYVRPIGTKETGKNGNGNEVKAI